MVNNRTFYAVKQLSVKDNRYANQSPLDQTIQVYASGTYASGATRISLSGTASTQALPSYGQILTGSGEVFYYSSISGTAAEGTEIALEGITRGYVGTAATPIITDNGAPITLKWTGWQPVHGVQSVGITTNFSLETVFEFGQIEVYENVEALPEIEVTIERVLDGTKPLWFMVTDDLADTLNAAVANYKADVGLTIYSDAQNRASGTPRRFVFMSGMYVSNVTFTYPVDGNFTESITMVGNDKTWLLANKPSGWWTAEHTGGDGIEVASGIGSGVQRRQNLDLTLSEFPTDLPGITGAGVGNGADLDEHLQTITLSVDIGREDLFELGTKKPFFKSVTFPVEVSATFECVTSEGDLVEALSDVDNNLSNTSITVVTDDGMTVDLGDECKLLSIDFGGGDAGGGNDTVTYTYQTFNVFSVSTTNEAYTPKVSAL